MPMTMAQTCGARVGAGGGSASVGRAARPARMIAPSQPTTGVPTFMVKGLHAAWFFDRSMCRGKGPPASLEPSSLGGKFDHDPEADLRPRFVVACPAAIVRGGLPRLSGED